jgi:hypothetical protein
MQNKWVELQKRPLWVFKHLGPNCCHLGKSINVIYREGSLPPPTGRAARQRRLLRGRLGLPRGTWSGTLRADLGRLEGVEGIIWVIPSNERPSRGQCRLPVMLGTGPVRSRLSKTMKSTRVVPRIDPHGYKTRPND